MARGFEVFRSLNHSGSCDVIAMSLDQFIRVEVKTADLRPCGSYFPSLKIRQGAHDVLAVVSTHDEITYIGEFVAEMSPASSLLPKASDVGKGKNRGSKSGSKSASDAEYANRIRGLPKLESIA
jgi:hypothetical protein